MKTLEQRQTEFILMLRSIDKLSISEKMKIKLQAIAKGHFAEDLIHDFKVSSKGLNRILCSALTAYANEAFPDVD